MRKLQPLLHHSHFFFTIQGTWFKFLISRLLLDPAVPVAEDVMSIGLAPSLSPEQKHLSCTTLFVLPHTQEDSEQQSNFFYKYCHTAIHSTVGVCRHFCEPSGS